MSKLNRGNSHISIGEYMTQAGWPLVGRVRGIVGYDNDEIRCLTVKDVDSYNWDSPYNTDECNSHIEYANKNRLYQWLYRLVGHPFISPQVLPVVSTLDNPELLRSPTWRRFDTSAVEAGEGAARKLTQGWQQFRGSFEPLRKSLKGLTKIFARYKSSGDVIDNDATSFLNGLGNVAEGLTQIVLVPIFLLFRLLKNVGLLLRHPFTGASYSNLLVRMARDLGYSITWIIEGSLETVQGVVRIVMQIPKWFIQMPIRGIRTAISGYALFAENSGTQTLIALANERVNATLTEKMNADGGVSYYKDTATNAFDELVGKITETTVLKKTVLKNHSWDNLQTILDGYNIAPKLYEDSWSDFYRAAAGAADNAPDFKGLIASCYQLKPKDSQDRDNKDYQEARAEIIKLLTDRLQQRYLDHLQETVNVSGVSPIFSELYYKASRAQELNGQYVGAVNLSMLAPKTAASSAKSAQETIQAFAPDAAKFIPFD